LLIYNRISIKFYFYIRAIASVVWRTISSIRTIASFTGEKQVIAKYDQSLIDAYTTVVKEALASGLDMVHSTLLLLSVMVWRKINLTLDTLQCKSLAVNYLLQYKISLPSMMLLGMVII
jgi:hypothetical protein